MHDTTRPSTEMARRPGIRGDLLITLLLGIVGWVCTGWYFDHGLDAFDAGLFAAEAERVMEGGVYGRDFLAPYGPGRYYLIALFFSFFGTSLKVQAALWLVLRGLVAMMMYLIGRRYLPKGLALLPALAVILAPGALHKSIFQTVVLANILGYLLYRRRPGCRVIALAGLVVGIGVLFRVDAGVFGFLSFVVLLWLEPVLDRPRPPPGRILLRTGAFVGGAAAVTLPVFFYFLAKADLALVFEAEWHRTANVSGFADTIQVPGFSDALEEPFPQGLKLFLLALMIRAVPVVYPVLILLLLARRIAGRFEQCGSPGLEAMALAIFGLPVLNQLRITPTFNHLLHAIPLVLISSVVLVALIAESPLYRRIPGRALQGLLAVAACILICGIPVFYNLAFTRGVLPGSILNRYEFTTRLDLDRAQIHETPGTAETLEKMVRYIESTTPPDARLFAGPFSPVLNFLADRAPAVRFLEPFYYFGNEALQRKVVEDLAGSKPPCIVLDAATRVGGQSLEGDAPLVFSFIRQNYDAAGGPGREPGSFQIWLRREAQ